MEGESLERREYLKMTVFHTMCRTDWDYIYIIELHHYLMDIIDKTPYMALMGAFRAFVSELTLDGTEKSRLLQILELMWLEAKKKKG